MKLPTLPNNIGQKQTESIALRGLYLSDGAKDGSLWKSWNLSAHQYPSLCPRRARKKLDEYDGATALTAWSELAVVKDGHIYYDGEDCGEVSAEGEKMFAVVNTKLVIFPDKKYLDVTTHELKDLGASASGNGATFTKDSMTVEWEVDLTEVFKEGDVITISGCETEAANNKDVLLKGVEEKKLTFEADSMTEASETATINLERKIPDMDFICESNNRLWGCSNKERTIYASALGDPTNFFTYQGLSTDSYAVAVGSEGDFTGCCKLSSSVLFWKTHTLHKVLGSYPSEYETVTYDMEGVQKGSHKSMQAVNETLYYLGEHGIFAYSGGSPVKVSQALGDVALSEGRAGTDGERYYLSCKDGDKTRLLVYHLVHRIWLQEDDTRASDFARIGKLMYFLTEGGEVYLADSGEEDPKVEWSAEYSPFYETMQGRKRYSRVALRTRLPKGAWIKAETRTDGGRWEERKKIIGTKTDTTTFVIAPNRGDRFEIRLSGTGPATVLSMLRQFILGSER